MTSSDGPTPDNAAATALRLLVVDDNRDAADSLGILLSLWGHRPRVAYDAKGAAEAAQADPPDAVLLDLGLPGQNAFALVDELRGTAPHGVMPVIAVTGYADDAHRRRAAEAGFAGYLVKPFEDGDLRALLDVAAAVRRLAGRAAALPAENQVVGDGHRGLIEEARRLVDDMRGLLGPGGRPSQ